METKYPASATYSNDKYSSSSSSFTNASGKSEDYKRGYKTQSLAEACSMWAAKKRKEDKVTNHNSFAVTKYANRLEINFQNVTSRSAVEHKLNIYDGKHIEHIIKDSNSSKSNVVPRDVKKIYKYDDCIVHYKL